MKQQLLLTSTITAGIILVGNFWGVNKTIAQTTNTQEVTINFQARVGQQPFECGKTYTLGKPATKVTAADFRFYVSDVALIDNKGKAVPVNLTQDGKWQYQNVALLDFENKSGGCANGTIETQILAMLQNDAKYRQMFTDAFSNEQDVINLSNLTKALAAFERTLISVNSPYDKYRFGGDANAISPAAKRGEKLFHSEKLECFHCHGGINFTDSVMHEKLAFQEIAFHNTGLYNIDGKFYVFTSHKK
ncbi:MULTISPECIES: MbnP family protein [Sphaerospermopsis]|jgi:hypothetical protein|uniref:MbnP family protein n=1 Tax=Sphaerospermopsis TaxID=752201 RepID=UPI001D14046A|nr:MULTISPECIES: MbnP family protein [Sphaerospermopsis]